MKILLRISYDGTDFCGWQVQKDLPTVQGEICRAVRKIYGTDADVSGCSRTDSGVHALEYYCTVDLPENCPNVPVDKLPLIFNINLPKEISVNFAKTVDSEFNVRYNVQYKRYKYVIDNSPVRDPFMSNRAWHIPQKLDVSAMDRAAKLFVGRRDFSCFMASGSNIKDAVRNVMFSEVSEEGKCMVFRVSADGFLYNMVRIMAGTLVYVGLDKIDIQDIEGIINSMDRTKAGITAPPQGLYLEHVKY